MRRTGFWLGTGLFFAMLLLPPPDALSVAAWRTAAVAVLMACWWFTEAVPVALTGALPFLLLPVLGVAKADAVAAEYMSPIIFLILGGSMLGVAMEKWGLHRRLALAVIQRVRPEPAVLLLAIMAVTALVSMWVNNSSTTVMMLPIAAATVHAVTRTLHSERPDPNEQRFAAAVVLSVAYASNIGGFATPIGTPVNPIAIGLVDRTFGVQISFLEWMAFGVPIMLAAVPLTWLILSRISFPFRLPVGSRERLVEAIGAVDRISAAEIRVAAVVVATSALWVSQPWLATLLPGLSDAAIAVAGAIALCLIPSGAKPVAAQGLGAATGRFLLEWPEARSAPWYLIMLLGGGLAIADSIVSSGLSDWLGAMLGGAAALPWLLLLLLVTAQCVLVTECASNLATAATFIPIAATLAVAGGHDGIALALAAGMAASWGFANPAGTSSNALVYGTGWISVRDMLRAGLWVDVLGVLLITVACWLIVPLLGFTPVG